MNRRSFFSSLFGAVVSAGVAMRMESLRASRARFLAEGLARFKPMPYSPPEGWQTQMIIDPGVPHPKVLFMEVRNTSRKTLQPGTLVRWNGNGGVTT